MVRSLVKFFQTPSGNKYAYDALSNRIITVKLPDRNARLDEKLCDKLYEQLTSKVVADEKAFESIEWKKSFEEYMALVERKIPKLLFELTRKCNLRCDYCVVSGAGCTLNQKNDISEETVIKAIDFFAERNKECESADIEFYGGEALIRFDLIKKAVEYAKEKIKDKPLSFGISTNGLLLDKKTAEWLNNNPEVRFTCTVNGPYHDVYRKTLSGGGSLDIIMDNLEYIKHTYPDVWKNQARFIANVDSDAQILPMLEFYRENIQKVPGIITTIDWSDNSDFAPEKDENDVKLFNEINFSDNLFARDYFKRSLWRMEHRTVRNGVKKGFIGSCFPGEVKLFVKQNGNIGFCEQACEASVIGNVESGIEENVLRSIYSDLSDLYNKKCKYCWAQRLCDNCAARMLDSQGKVVKSIPESFCRQMKEKIGDDLILFCKMAEEAPEIPENS